VTHTALSEMTVQAQIRLPSASVEIVRFVLVEPIDGMLAASDGYRLNLSLTPRPLGSRGGFVRQWGAHRFEPLGDIFLVPPDHVLHIRGHGGRQAALVCELRPEAVDRFLDREIEWTDRRLEAALDITSPHIRSVLGRLAEEAHRPGLASPALSEMMIGQLAIELGRYCSNIDDGPATGGLSAWRLRVIDERLRDAQSPPGLAELAELCSLSIRQLTRGFRASRGCSINDYVSRGRIESAKRLLAGPDSVKAIAFAMGFSSPSSFAHAFRRDCGVTPRQFRQRTARSTA
jgi:AraC family transcriptional regulator